MSKQRFVACATVGFVDPEREASEQSTATGVAVDRSGLVPFERALLRAVADCGKRGSLQVLTKLAGGVPPYPPNAAYRALADLTKTYVVPLPLITGDGNFGLWDEEPADPAYTKCTPSRMGMLALSAIRGDGPPIPFDLINGSLHRGGARPALDPRRVANAILEITRVDHVAPARVREAVGAPMFLTGCKVEGDVENLLAGNRTSFTFTGRVSQSKEGLFVTGLPVGTPEAAVERDIKTVLGRFAMSHSTPDAPRIFVGVTTKDDLDTFIESLLALPSMTSTLELDMAAPVDELIERWIHQRGREDAAAGAIKLLGELE